MAKKRRGEFLEREKERRGEERERGSVDCRFLLWFLLVSASAERCDGPDVAVHLSL